MNPVAFNSNLLRWTQQFRTNCYFKFILPRIERTTLHGVQLELRSLPPKIRNRILNLGYEEAEREMCHEMLTFTDSVLELGGGIGFLGLFCQLKLGIRKYITVEANPATIEILKSNYRLNKKEPFVWNFAVGPANTRVHLDVSGDFWGHHIAEASKSPDSIVVESVTVAALLQKAGIEITTLIIDIEGAESHIDFNELPSSVTKIIIEVHHDVLSEDAVKRIFSNIRSQGFRTAHCKGETFGFLRN